jgi:hypothetical protein
MEFLMRLFFYGLLGITIFFSGCDKQPTYAEQLKARQMPQTQQDKQNECSFIRQQIAQMQSGIQLASAQKCNPQYGLCMGPVVIARNNANIASLESRASEVQCDAAFSTVKVINNNSNNSIKECIAACKENTNRSSTECFDSCNK